MFGPHVNALPELVGPHLQDSACGQIRFFSITVITDIWALDHNFNLRTMGMKIGANLRPLIYSRAMRLKDEI
jgi:hypothetical protein